MFELEDVSSEITLTKDDFPEIMYFIDNYFNASVDYEELPSAILEYKMQESKEVQDSLIKEITITEKAGNLEIFKQILNNNGGRKPNNEKIRWILGTIRKGLAVNDNK